MSNFLEREALLSSIISKPRSPPPYLSLALLRIKLTVSFSTICWAPRVELLSNVSIELSRYSSQIPNISFKKKISYLYPDSTNLLNFPREWTAAYIKRCKVCPVLIEGLVVELNKLFCRSRKRSLGRPGQTYAFPPPFMLFAQPEGFEEVERGRAGRNDMISNIPATLAKSISS